MRYRLQGNVTIPKRPSTVGGMIGWAARVNRTLQELRDRKIVGLSSSKKGGGSIVSFKISPVAGAAKITCKRNGGIIKDPDGTEYIPNIGGVGIDTDPAPELSVITGVIYFEVDNTASPPVVNIKNAAILPTDVFNGTDFIMEQAYITICNVTVSGTDVTISSPQTVRTSLGYLLADFMYWHRI